MVESYLFEWVRDGVLNKNFELINQYFPSNRKIPITDRWKIVIDDLYKNKMISVKPDLGTFRSWEDFKTLVKFRNGLIHASASRPETSDQPETERPFPSLDDLQNKQNGWATGVVVDLIRELHQAVGTATPAWLIYP